MTFRPGARRRVTCTCCGSRQTLVPPELDAEAFAAWLLAIVTCPNCGSERETS